MALIECKDCKKEFSTDAKRCPNCGAKKVAKTSPIITFFTLLLLAGIAAPMFNAMFSSDTSPPAQSQPSSIASAPIVPSGPEFVWPPKPQMPSFEKEAYIKAYFSDAKQANPKIIGYTNLPDGTALMIELSSKDVKFMAQSQVSVYSNKFETDKFSTLGGDLPSGRYEVSIVTPLTDLQPPSVAEILGKNGKNMKGKNTKVSFANRGLNYVEALNLNNGDPKVAIAKYKDLQKAQKEKELSEKEAQLPSARYACKEFVKKLLNDPDSAEFEPTNTYPAEYKGNNLYAVQVTARARNGFNALRWATFDCQIYSSGGNWVPAKIKQRLR